MAALLYAGHVLHFHEYISLTEKANGKFLMGEMISVSSHFPTWWFVIVIVFKWNISVSSHFASIKYVSGFPEVIVLLTAAFSLRQVKCLNALCKLFQCLHILQLYYTLSVLFSLESISVSSLLSTLLYTIILSVGSKKWLCNSPLHFLYSGD